MKLTPIFPAHIKPVRVGVYMVTKCAGDPIYYSSDPLYYSYWNGKWWGYYDFTPAKAFRQRKNKSEYQNKRWQGVLK